MVLYKEMRRAKFKGFSLIELMISAVLFAVITVTSLMIYTKLKRKEMEAQVQGELALTSKIIQETMTRDIENIVRLTDDTTAGTHFEDTRTFGITRFPFQEVGEDVSDGLQLIVSDVENSLDSSFSVLSAQPNGTGGTQFVVRGDFIPLKEKNEDLFVVRKAGRSELFTRIGNIQTSGVGGALTSTFQSKEAFPNAWLPIHSDDPPQIFRVERRIYQIGDNRDAQSGLYRIRQGLPELISNRVTSMQVRYELSARELQSQADCESKNKNRYFPHDSSLNECDWNDVSAVHVELVLESEQEIGLESLQPHTLVKDGRIKHLLSFIKIPNDYVSELTN